MDVAEAVDTPDVNEMEAKPETTADLKPKQHLTATVTRITLGGAIVDIGLEKPGFVHLARITEKPINRVEEVLEVGQTVDVWVFRADPQRPHVELTMIEPLKYEWRELKKGMVVSGTVTKIENFGVFVEIGAERPGMIHVSELAHKYVRNPHEVVSVGDEIEAKVLAVNRRKKQIKLSIKALLEKQEQTEAAPSLEEVLKESKEDAPVPTAMEIALREAMNRSKGETITGKAKPKAKSQPAELENILTRTLETYTPSK